MKQIIFYAQRFIVRIKKTRKQRQIIFGEKRYRYGKVMYKKILRMEHKFFINI